jgi:hypothetical protein
MRWQCRRVCRTAGVKRYATAADAQRGGVRSGGPSGPQASAPLGLFALRLLRALRKRRRSR